MIIDEYDPKKLIWIYRFDPFNGKATAEQGRIVTRKQHGFNLESGGWCAYNLSKEKNEPAYFIGFIPKGCKKPRVINEKTIVRITDS